MTPLQCALTKSHFKMAQLLIECGATMCPLDNLNDLDISESPASSESCDFWLWYVIHASNPLSLVDITVVCIRKILGLKLEAKLETLPLPSLLKRSLRLDYVFDSYA